jgi:dihydroflavonol-4-reductase
MDVLVTGATGFLGSHVAAQLLARGHRVRGLVRKGRDASGLAAAGAEIATGDLLDEGSLRAACKGMEGLVHCAAMTGNWSRRTAAQRAVNVEGTARLYRAAHDRKIARIVHVSTIATLGANREGKPLDESCACNIRHLRLPYVESKLESEERALSAAWGGMPVVIVNPCHIAGPRLDGRFPAAVARLAARRMRLAPPGGISVADVEDVADSILAALERGAVGERYLLGGHDLSFVEFYARLARTMGVAGPTGSYPRAAGWTLARAAGVLDLVGLSRPRFAPERFRVWGWYTYADSSKAARVLGHKIRPLEEILLRTAGPKAAERP